MGEYSFFILMSYGAVFGGLGLLAFSSFLKRKRLQQALDAIKLVDEDSLAGEE